MKGLNIKRIAAIGLGAALVGSALAPVVSAANVVPTGLDELGRDTVITATGAPAVDVVVGANAAVSDVVWAGNIAARVAQLATKPVTCTADAGTVDLTVGGTTSLSGAGQLKESIADFTNGNAELTGLSVTNTRMPELVNNSSAKLRYDATDNTVTVKEQLEGSMDADFQSGIGSSEYASGELIGLVEAGAVKYTVSLGMDMNIKKMLTSGMDNSSDWDIQIPFLGKNYVLDGIGSTGSTRDSLILYANTTPIKLYPEETISVPGAGTYVGKTLTIQLETVYITQDQSSKLNAVWLLKDGESLINRKEVEGAGSSYDLRETFGTSIVGDSVHVTNVARDVISNKYYASIRSGKDRIELKVGKGFPWTGNNTESNRAQWRTVFYKNGSETTDLSSFDAVGIVNQWEYKRTSGSESDSSTNKFVLKVGEAVTLPNDFAKFQFNGFIDQAKSEALLGDVSGIDNGGLSYVDLRSNNV